MNASPLIFKALEGVMAYYPGRFDEQALAEVDILLDHCINGIADRSEKLLATLFLAALKNHIGPTSIDEHIYLANYPLPQITLFDDLIRRFPFVSHSHRLVVETLAAAMEQTPQATVVDVGIGRGLQMASLLRRLQAGGRMKSVRVIGIEPFADALATSRQQLTQLQTELSFEIEFVGFGQFVEQQDWQQLRAACLPDAPYS